jgi:hypothetical protein
VLVTVTVYLLIATIAATTFARRGVTA